MIGRLPLSSEGQGYLGGCQPPGEPPEVPLATDVGAWPEQHIQAKLLGDVQEALNVRLAIPLEGARAPLVEVPRHIQLHHSTGGKFEALSMIGM